MQGRVQIVGRLPVALNRRVRAAATRRKVSLNAFLIEALTQALGSRRGPACAVARVRHPAVRHRLGPPVRGVCSTHGGVVPPFEVTVAKSQP